MDGILPLYKERGMTSSDCVFKVRRILHTKKVGHSGTLDPNVDGVLPICIGQATKVVDQLVHSGKIYTGEITIGLSTTTEDLDGEIVEEVKMTEPLSKETIETTLASFLGDSIQIPPMFSAVKVNGRRLYDYARAGETVERPQRSITISQFDLDGEITFDEATGHQKFRFVVGCSKGTYIRTLAVDFGRKLGLPAVMSDLTRLKSGGIQIGDCVTLAQLTEKMEANQLADVLIPLDHVFANVEQVVLDDDQWAKVLNGVFLTFENQTVDQLALTYQGHIKAIYQLDAGQAHVYRPFKMYLQNQGTH
ncbi:tRNA pseudouridine(55) synthase TruB [Latilactobacillus fuchuensis]|uniref:tRNA pseudouridine synthase B n=2 Tax=Latilactobacillus fuchuensis TaxID=164393 RepID=A0A2N9DY72_9LACO|nr:tRNA pseudouridine(55) synthase TruB [Latilactobacillus fuchuensis]KRL59581.1 tRNA pseudouridine synthase B [Latilactobacillus fuchuensis DSM 14340 = JCM 11249]SPC40084.1 tRNA pseudouridine 55 synthase [Latilactobacillus fuchuensis]